MTTEPYAPVVVTATGAEETFPFPFPYLSLDHVKVLVDGVQTTAGGATFPSANAAVIAPAPTAGQLVVIYRETPLDAPQATWTGSSVSSAGLNANQLQVMYATDEARFDIDRAYKVGFNTANPEDTSFEGLVQDAADLVTPAALASIAAAGATQVTLVNNEGADSLALIAGAIADGLDALGLPGSLIDIIPESAGFDAGLALTTENGWTTTAAFFKLQTGFKGPVVRLKFLPAAKDAAVQALTAPQHIFIAPGWGALTPEYFLRAASAVTSGGRHIANVQSLTPPSDNLFTLNNGTIRNTASTVTLTNQAALGPDGVTPNKATQGFHTATNSALRFLNDVLPGVGTVWDLCVEMQGTLASTIVKTGSALSLSTVTITNAAWTHRERLAGGFTSDGVTAIDFQARGDGTNTPTVLYAQLQGYVQGTRPSWSAEMLATPYNNHVKKRLSYTGSITLNGNNEVVLTGGVNFAHQLVPSYPEPFPITRIWHGDMIDCVGSQANLQRWWGTEVTTGEAYSAPNTTANSMYCGLGDTDGYLITAPVNTGGAGSPIYLKDAGPVIIHQVDEDGHRGVYVDGMPCNVMSTARPTDWKVRLINRFGSSAGSLGPTGSWINGAGGFDQSITGDEIAEHCVKMQYEDASSWARGGTRNKIVVSGDSTIAVIFPAGTQGPSAIARVCKPGVLTRPLIGTGGADSGSNLNDFRGRFLAAGHITAPTRKYSDADTIRLAVAAGNNTFFFFNMSPNDISRWGSASLRAQYILDAVELAQWAYDICGVPTIIQGLSGHGGASPTQLTSRDFVNSGMVAHSGNGVFFRYADQSGISTYNHSLASPNTVDFEDDLHYRGNSAGNGQDKVVTVIQPKVALNLVA